MLIRTTVIIVTIISCRSASPRLVVFAVGSARVYERSGLSSLLWRASVSTEAMNRPEQRETEAFCRAINEAIMTDPQHPESGAGAIWAVRGLLLLLLMYIYHPVIGANPEWRLNRRDRVFKWKSGVTWQDFYLVRVVEVGRNSKIEAGWLHDIWCQVHQLVHLTFMVSVSTAIGGSSQINDRIKVIKSP